MSSLIERLQRKKAKSVSLENRRGHKLPFCLLVDTSGSMEHNDNIGKLNSGIRSFFNELLADSAVRDHIEVSIVSFGKDGIRVELDFDDIANQQVPTFKQGGSTPLCPAVMTAIDLLEDQIDLYNTKGIISHPPVLVIMTDGEPTTLEYDANGVPIRLTPEMDDFKKAKAKFDRFKSLTKMTSYSIGVGDEIENPFFLEQFAGSPDHVRKLDDANIVAFFQMLSRSASVLSKSVPKQGGSLEVEVDLLRPYRKR